MKDIFELYEQGKENLEQGNAIFQEQADTALGIMVAQGVLPYKRALKNGYLHKRLCAVLVTAFNEQEDILVSSRRLGKYHSRGITTNFLNWLDDLVDKKLMNSDSPQQRAEGVLTFGDVFKHHLKAVA